ncbi:hypothetical protein V490_07942 [Pseudogymnoascus sp. VKM F-3557]|nr:hypothetical protein V490_07942 [Pseudogymnoascus sp. VKM F-3557]
MARNLLQKRSAIIIGGGPAGVSAALCLHRETDISCRVYEIRAEPTTQGGAIGIPCNGLRLIHRLGLHDAVLSRGSSRSNLVIRSLQGNSLGEQDLVGEARDETGFGYLRIKRTDLQDVLLGAANKAEIPIHYNKRLTAVEESEGGVTVRFSDGTTDTADLLLGCDGIHSSVRRLYVDPQQLPEYSGLSAIGSIVPTSVLSESAAADIRGMNVTLTQEGMFLAMTCTASDNEIFWGFQMEIPEPKFGDSKDGRDLRREEELGAFRIKLQELLERAGSEWVGTMSELVNKSSVMGLIPIYKLPTGGTWFKGRCLLIGDAAHAMQPHAGQGISTALEDGFLLARLLKDTSRSLNDVYERFDQIRRPRVEEIHRIAGNNMQIRKRAGPWGLWFKELGIWAYFGATSTLGFSKKVSTHKHLIYDIGDEKL